MRFYIYLEDLKEQAIEEIRRILKAVLVQDIEEAVEAGVDREAVEAELIDSYLNRHNFRIPVEL